MSVGSIGEVGHVPQPVNGQRVRFAWSSSSAARCAAVGVAIVVAAGCGAHAGQGRGDSSAPGDAPASTPSTTPPSREPSSLVDIGSLPACGQVASYLTLPDWVPAPLPSGLRLAGATTEVRTEDLVDEPIPTVRTLVDVDGTGTVVGAIELWSGVPAARVPYWDFVPGYGVRDDQPVLDAVRSAPGRVARVINRGDPVGFTGAQWPEGGLLWAAGSQSLDVAELAAALEPLVLDGVAVSDPTWRFRELGTKPAWSSGRSRTTRIELSVADTEGDTDRSYDIEITPPAPGQHGLSSGMGVGATLSEVDGRSVAVGPRSVVSVLADESTARITTRSENGGDLLDERVAAEILGVLHARSPRDQELLESSPLVTELPDGSPPQLCVET